MGLYKIFKIVAMLLGFAGLIFWFLCIFVDFHQSNPGVKSKRHLTNKNTSFFSSGFGTLSLLET